MKKTTKTMKMSPWIVAEEECLADIVIEELSVEIRSLSWQHSAKRRSFVAAVADAVGVAAELRPPITLTERRSEWIAGACCLLRHSKRPEELAVVVVGPRLRPPVVACSSPVVAIAEYAVVRSVVNVAVDVVAVDVVAAALVAVVARPLAPRKSSNRQFRGVVA